jgi:hypothetical protein
VLEDELRGALEFDEDWDVAECVDVEDEFGVIELSELDCVGAVGEAADDDESLLFGVLGELRVPRALASRNGRCEPVVLGFNAELEGE